MAFTFATTNVGGDPQCRGGATVALNDIVISDSIIPFPNHTATLTAGVYNTATYFQATTGVGMDLSYDIYINNILVWDAWASFSGRTVASSSSWASTSANISAGTTVGETKYTSSFFNSSNPTAKSVPITLKRTWLQVYNSISGGQATSVVNASGSANLILNAPPTYTLSALSTDTPYIYTGLTTASVTVSSLSAKYGGTIEDVTLTIGNQTASRTNNGTLSILLNAVGTFTPTVTVTDSRGQTTTKTLDPITVNGYVTPSLSFDVERTTSTGTPDDEGAYATVDAILTFTDVVADAVAPTIVVTDNDGNTQTVSTTWYSTRASDGTLSGSVTWANLSSGDTVYGLVSITGGFNTQKSYQIELTPEDSQSTGTPITQTLATAFYTLDFLAGGHGIAFGKPAINTGFECAMDATFEETLTAQDMTPQEVDDFVDNISGGGSPVVDKIVEQGQITTSYNSKTNTWIYRKWASGLAEAWSYLESTTNASGDWSTIAYCPNFFISSTPLNANASGWSASNANGGVRHVHPFWANDWNGWVVDTWVRNGNANTPCGISWYIVGKWK